MATIYQGMTNSPPTKLTNAIDAIQTTIAVDELGVLPPAPNIATIGNDPTAETILYTGKSAASGAGQLTGITRAIDISNGYGVARGWNAGVMIARNITKYDIDALQAGSGGGGVDIGTATALAIALG